MPDSSIDASRPDPDTLDNPGFSTAGERVAPLSSFSTLRQLVRATPLPVPPSASVRETLLKLDTAHTDAIVVVDEASRVALGIVTLRDVLRLSLIHI